MKLWRRVADDRRGSTYRAVFYCNNVFKTNYYDRRFSG